MKYSSFDLSGPLFFQSAPEDAATGSTPNDDVAVSSESDSTATESSAVIDKDNQVTANDPDRVDSLGTNSNGNSQVSSADGTLVGKIPDSANSVRKRIPSTSRDAATKERVNKAPVSEKAPNGLCTLILLWIVVLSLVVLIFRRLCIDALLIGGSK